ncbi:hypothetical protein CPU12_06945 [Malaciobacter molluscorum LMG 25693]|uniref:Signal transduction response regulator, OmpR family n=1 Tax=Malaciobacter molluscorum LMG 25693 TaxID=870501 RepID=A0A2G1DI83_9BACT|nr:response regulator transcription factor [Malaciobacter molluscorum]AXX92354.1 signal transduction response regulator, OmpR family [Malaciobacter molluscorum LMG 25693]PHO18195.1 hypothetical protein CPU12_06945 [Malaciobacter molluscorum LMG 25693]
MVDYILLEQYCKDISILFVEDDKSIRKEMKDLLKELFFEKDITIANDGKEGFLKYQEYFETNNKTFDIVLTDVKMPKMDGLELIKKIYEQNPNQLIVVLSGESETHHLISFVNLGISYFLEKPLNYDEFIELIYTLTNKIYEQNNLNKKINIEEININDNLIWNTKTKQLLKDNNYIKLTKKENLLIETLLKTPKKTHSVEEIIPILWEDSFNKEVDVKNLKNIVSRLRKKIPELNIENIYSLGYRINIL